MKREAKKHRTLIFFVLLGLVACDIQTHKQEIILADGETNQNIQYSEKEVVCFLDSIGNLNPNIWAKNLTFIVDSTLNGQIKLDHKISSKDFEKLKSNIKSGFIDIQLAKQIFPELEYDSTMIIEADKLSISFYSFDQRKENFNEFAICIGDGNGFFWNNDVYFFKSNKVIAKHKIYHRYGLELSHFKNEIDETVIYYKVCFGSGTGIWWYQFNFYCYEDDNLVPKFTEIENINLQLSWSSRAYWIESKVINTRPLKLKFVFYNQFIDSIGNEIDFINDSTDLIYSFDKEKKAYKPKFGDTKLNRLKLLSYFHTANELLFVNLNYDLFKIALSNTDILKRQAILMYLNGVKNRLN